MPDMSVSVYKLCMSRVNHHDPTLMELPCRVALGMVAACTPFHACTVLVCVSDKCLSLWHDLWGNNQGISLVPNGLRFLLIVSVYLTAEVSHQTVLPRPAAVSNISAVSLSWGCFPGPPVCLLQLLWLDRLLTEMGEMLLGGGHPLWTRDPNAARGSRSACDVLGFIDLCYLAQGLSSSVEAWPDSLICNKSGGYQALCCVSGWGTEQVSCLCSSPTPR